MDLSTQAPRVLVVDDDPRLLAALEKSLTLQGFQVQVSRDAGEALKVIDEGWQDVIVLDVMMPVVDGLSLCRLVREKIDSPILLLTALESVEDRVLGLEAGADDYLTKPFATSELVARLTALLRRANRVPHSPTLLSYKGLTLDTGRWQALRDGRDLGLTSMEFRILEMLLRAREHVVTREHLLGTIWQRSDAVESNVVDVHIASLRQKLETGGSSRLIQTVRGVGYVLRD